MSPLGLAVLGCFAVLGGCGESALIVRGNMPGTAWVARQTARMNSAVFCGQAPQQELRGVTVSKKKMMRHI